MWCFRPCMTLCGHIYLISEQQHIKLAETGLLVWCVQIYQIFGQDTWYRRTNNVT